MWDGPSLNLSKGIYKEGVKPHHGEPKLFPHEANGGFMLICNNPHTVPMLADAAHSFASYWGKGKCLYEWWCHDQYFVNQAIGRAIDKGANIVLFDKHKWVNGWFMKNRVGYRMNPLVAEGFYNPNTITEEEKERIFDLSSSIAVHANWCETKEQKIVLFLREAGSPWWACDRNCALLNGIPQLRGSSNPLFDTDGNCQTTAQLKDWLWSLDV